MKNANAVELGLSTQEIPAQEIAAHSLSFSDYNGRLFCWKDGLYRAIPAEQAPLYQELFDCGAVRSLTQKKLLVPTALTNLTLGASGMVLRHRRIPFISYPWEWCNGMFKAAALHHLAFCIELDRYNCTTDDAHPINILFEGCHPAFVDFGSINRLRSDLWYPWPWPPYAQFCQTFLYPLLLKANGQGRLARWSLHDFENGVLKSDIDALINRPLSRLRLAEAGARFIQKGHGAMGRWVLRLSRIKSSRRAFLQQVSEEVAAISFPSDAKIRPGDRAIPLPKNYSLVHRILSDLNPQSVLDIDSGNSHGCYALLAAELGARVIAADGKEVPLSYLYQQASAKNANILPVWLNFASPSYGLSNNFLEPAHHRLQCELVMALGLDRELMLKRGFDFVVDRLAVFSRRWLLLEFVQPPDPVLTTRWQERTIACPWYTLENLILALEGSFTEVQVLPSSDPSRRLLLCQR